MEINANYTSIIYNSNNIRKNKCSRNKNRAIEYSLNSSNRNINFQSNPFIKIMDYAKFYKAQRKVDRIVQSLPYIKNSENLLFRNLSMENIEGLQNGIKVFEGLSMKDIQYLCENLHVIAVKRGCTNMCGHCYADAKPQKKEMSWEDYKLIIDGIKEIRKRLHNLPIYGENSKIAKNNAIYRVTELFYDADGINLAIKDKKGKIYDFIDMLEEINSIGRKSCFDTSGWNPENKKLQERAETYVKYFSKNENIEKLEEFNLSFNVFSAHNIAAVNSEKKGDITKAKRLRGKYTDRIANAIFTFTPLLDKKQFNILTRSFSPNSRHSKGFDIKTMTAMIYETLDKLVVLYNKDLLGEQKYIKSEDDLKKYTKLACNKLVQIDTALNSAGRMKNFMAEFKIEEIMQDHNQTLPYIIQDLNNLGRQHKIIGHRLIDTDGKVYHMDYARFIPTDIQLNISNKSEAPKLANLVENFKLDKNIINMQEKIISTDELNL